MPKQPKPILKMQRIPVFRVHYTDFENYVKQVFGFTFDFFLATGVVPGLCPEYRVSGEVGSHSVQKIAMNLREGQRTKNMEVILNVLVEDGYIDAGQYVFDTRPLPTLNDLTETYRTLLRRSRDPQTGRALPDMPVGSSTDCLAFKSKYKSDAELMDRVKIIEEDFERENNRARKKRPVEDISSQRPGTSGPIEQPRPSMA